MPWFDDYYHLVEKLHGLEKAKLVAESYSKAIDWVEQTVKQESIDCSFSRVDGFLYPHEESKEAHDRLQKVCLFLLPFPVKTSHFAVFLKLASINTSFKSSYFRNLMCVRS
jgi:hypothetical protein